MKVNDLYGKIYVFPSRIISKEVNMDNTRNYKVKGKKMLPKSYNLRHQQAVRLAIKLAKRRRLDAAS